MHGGSREPSPGQLLMAACDRGHLDVVSYLVEQKEVNIHIANEGALRLAVLNGHLSIVKYLINQGANIHINNEEALRWAAESGHLSVVKYLVEKGADVSKLKYYSIEKILMPLIGYRCLPDFWRKQHEKNQFI